MKRDTIVLATVAVISLLVGIALFQLTVPGQSYKGAENKPTALSAIPFTDELGQQKLLSDWEQPVLIINFWAPWCTPCRREIPALVKIQHEYGEQVQVIGLALDSVENVQSFADEYNMNYRSYIVGEKISMYNAAFNNKSGSLPHTAIVNQQRIMAYSHTGEVTAPQLRTEIDRLLGR